MPRPRAAIRALFEDTGSRRCGGKFNVFVCKRCGVEILENAYRFAVHISVCKKATEEDRALAAQQLNKSKKNNPPTPRNSVPGDVDIYSAGLPTARPNPQKANAEYGLSHRFSESVVTRTAGRLRPSDGQGDFPGMYGSAARFGDFPGGNTSGLSPPGFRPGEGYDKYGTDYAGSSFSQSYGGMPGANYFSNGGMPGTHVFSNSGQPMDGVHGLGQQGSGKGKIDWSSTGSDELRQAALGASMNWRYNDMPDGSFRIPSEAAFQGEIMGGSMPRFGDYQAMPGRNMDDIAGDGSRREFHRSGVPLPFGLPDSAQYGGSYPPEMALGFDGISDFYAPSQMGFGMGPQSYGYGNSKLPFPKADYGEGGGIPEGLTADPLAWNSSSAQEWMGYSHHPSRMADNRNGGQAPKF